MNNLRAYVICGPVQHGKSTLASLLFGATTLRWGDCSSIIYTELANRLNIPLTELTAKPKSDIRQQLIETGDDLCKDDPGILPKQLYYAEQRRVIAGVRRVAELQSFREAIGETNAIPIWVDRLGGANVSDNTEDDLMEQCSIIVRNHGTLDDLAEIARYIGDIQTNPKGFRVDICPRGGAQLDKQDPQPDKEITQRTQDDVAPTFLKALKIGLVKCAQIRVF